MFTNPNKQTRPKTIIRLTTTILAASLALTLAACEAPPSQVNPSATSEQSQVISTSTSPAVPTQTSAPKATITPTKAPATSDKSTAGSFQLPQKPVLAKVSGEYLFTEGPAEDGQGNVYFSDINAGKIYKWSPDGTVKVFVDQLKSPNGLFFDQNGMLIACEGGNGRLLSIDPQGKITVLADTYNGLRFNEPNDLWIDSLGGIYFTDPAYSSPVVQEGEDVYYLAPDHQQVVRVITDLVRPNGLVGTQDGKLLYVADHGAGKIYSYAIQADDSLSDKRLFAPTGSDGMTLDAAGNLYLTIPNEVQVYSASGNLLGRIAVPENPTNVTFTSKDEQTLIITARTAVYTVQMSKNTAAAETSASQFTLTSPDISTDGLLPTEYTCDGASSTLALSWRGAPSGTKSFAVIMHHVAGPEDIHWYWVLYNIPVDTTNLPKNMKGIGTLGINSVNGRQEYTPPCSKGPGAKDYSYTVYALSGQPQFSVPANKVTRAVLLDAIKDITLSSAEIKVSYARP